MLLSPHVLTKYSTQICLSIHCKLVFNSNNVAARLILLHFVVPRAHLLRALSMIYGKSRACALRLVIFFVYYTHFPCAQFFHGRFSVPDDDDNDDGATLRGDDTTI